MGNLPRQNPNFDNMAAYAPECSEGLHQCFVHEACGKPAYVVKGKLEPHIGVKLICLQGFYMAFERSYSQILYRSSQQFDASFQHTHLSVLTEINQAQHEYQSSDN